MYSSEECGVSFQYPSDQVVVQITSGEQTKGEESDICSLAVHNRTAKGQQPNPAIHVVRGTLEKIAEGEGVIRDPQDPEVWTFADANPVGHGRDEQGKEWRGIHMYYAIRLFGEHGYEGMGDAEMLIACNGMDRCMVFNTEDLGYPTFNLILKTLHFQSTHK